jgi:hypothetical protein
MSWKFAEDKAWGAVKVTTSQFRKRVEIREDCDGK